MNWYLERRGERERDKKGKRGRERARDRKGKRGV